MAYESRPLEYIPTPERGGQVRQALLTPLEAIRWKAEQHNKDREAGREASRDQQRFELDRSGQALREREVAMSDRREGGREARYQSEDKRREAEATFNRERLTHADHEALIQELYHALNDPGQQSTAQQNRVKAAQEALERSGYKTSEVEDTPTGPTMPPATAAPDGQLEEVGAPGGPTPGNTHAVPLSTGAAAALAPPHRRMPASRANALSSQLDAADRVYSKGLGVAPGIPGQQPAPPFLPGRSMAPQVAQSNAMLSPDDPYNQLVK